MSLSMHQVCIVQSKRMLNNLSAILIKAEAHCVAKKIETSVLLNSRLSLDMFPLVRQVQIATDMIKYGVARLSDVDAPKFEDKETDFAELEERIQRTINFLNSITKDQIDGSESKEIKFSIRDNKFEFIGEQYLSTWILPHFYFHVTTTYNILRHNGIEIGKRYYTGG